MIQGLSQTEEMLISAVMPLMSIYRLPHGQFGYKGHVINLPQDLTSFATSLPRRASELDVILVRKEGTKDSHRDFRVRRSIVLRALQWLKKNNKYYQKIEIDLSALNELPEDGDMPGIHEVMTNEAPEDEQEKQPTDDMSAEEYGSFVPAVARKMTEEESIKKSIQDRQSMQPDETVPWPSSKDAPINEFKTCRVPFPHCFPLVQPTSWHHDTIL